MADTEMQNGQTIEDMAAGTEESAKADGKKQGGRFGKKQMGILAAIAVIIVAVAIGVIGVRSAQRQRQYDSHIAAAEKYLVNLDYEQAIVEYTLALAIEPKNVELLDALEQTYLDYAQSLADAGEYAKALSVLEEGYAQIGRESLREKMQKIREVQEKRAEEKRKEEIKLALEKNRQKIGGVASYVFLRSGEADCNHMSDAQVEELCRPLIGILEQYIAIFGEEDPEIIAYRDDLAWLYYGAGEYELCAKTRERLYEMTSNEIYREGLREEVYSDSRSEGMIDKYGRYINGKEFYNDDSSFKFSEYNKEYGENEKLIKRTDKLILDNGETSSSTTYEYDSLGRLVKSIHSFHSYNSLNGYQQDDTYIYTYIYHEEGYTEHYSEDIRTNIHPDHQRGWSVDYKIVVGDNIDDRVCVGEIYDVWENN